MARHVRAGHFTKDISFRRRYFCSHFLVYFKPLKSTLTCFVFSDSYQKKKIISAFLGGFIAINRCVKRAVDELPQLQLACSILSSYKQYSPCRCSLANE